MSHSETLTLLVMAAGMGTRYGGLKQLDRVGPSGETLMDYAVYDAWRAGFKRVVFIIRPSMESDFREQVLPRYRRKLETEYVFQLPGDLPSGFRPPPDREKPWGTGHAVFCARRVIDGPFAVVNADDFYGRQSYSLLAGHLSGREGMENGNYALCAFALGNTLSDHGAVSRGICRLSPDGLLAGINEHTGVERKHSTIIGRSESGRERALDESQPVSMNAWAFNPSLFPHLERLMADFLETDGAEAGKEFYLPAAVGSLVVGGRARVRVLLSGERWFGVTYRQDLENCSRGIREQVSAGLYPADLFSPDARA